MRSKIMIAALLLVAATFTSANATTLLFTGGTGTVTDSTTGISVSGFGFHGGAVTPTTATAATLTSNSNGWGLAYTGDTSKDIQYSDFVVLDFSSLAAQLAAKNLKLNSLSINLDTVIAQAGLDWEIYGTNIKPSTTSPNNKLYGNANDVLLAGPTAIGASGATFNPTVYNGTGTLYSYYIIAVDCPVYQVGGIEVYSAALTTSPKGQVPEPATFLMAGIALIGLGATMKKFQKKA